MEISAHSSSHELPVGDFVDGDLFPRGSAEEGTLRKMQTLVSKLWNGQALDAADQEFLATSSKATASWGDRFVSYFRTPNDESYVAAINFLSEKILTGRFSTQEALRNIGTMLASKSELSARELAGLSQLLLACQRRDPDLSVLVGKATARPVFRDELIPMVDQYNYNALPKKERAGEVVARFTFGADHWGNEREGILRFNRMGFLEIVDGVTSPMDVSARQTLTREQVGQLRELYTELNRDFYYNNLGVLLEFAHFHAQAQARRPEQSIRESFEAFNPSLVDFDMKYRSGTCGILASRFVHESAERLGIEGQCVSHFTENNWSVVPIPGSEESPIKWTALTSEVHGFDHTDAVVVFRDEEGSRRVIKFACSVEKDYEDEIKEYLPSQRQRMDGVEFFFRMSGSSLSDRPNRSHSDGAIEKSFFKGRFKVAMSKDGKVMGVDFLRGNFYMNKSWSDKIKGIPKNAAGMVSIDLRDLAQPHQEGTYFVDGKEVRMTHAEALNTILNEARKEFHIPDDVAIGIVQLAQMAPAMSRELYIQPLPFIQEHYATLQVIGKRMNELRPSFDKVPDSEQEILYRKMSDRYDRMIDHLINDYNPEAAREVMESIVKEFCTR
ncbi:MAG: hypothetical protein H7A41_05375 [Chlamydiales bacterium]|nr:hypothetical protein [Chlamydiales bacterium]